MKTRNLLRSLAAFAVAALAVPALPAAAQPASFSMFVVLGDSIPAGYLDACLVEYGQHDDFGAILARQAGAAFEQPTISKPGLGGCMYLKSLFSATGALSPSFGKRDSNGPPDYGATNINLPRPYNNLAVGGFKMNDLVDTNPTSGAGALVLRGLGTAVQQAAALHPTFLAVTIGGNDVLGAAAYGTPIDATPTFPCCMTPKPFFEAKAIQVWNALKNDVQGGTAKGYFVTIPDVTLIAFVNAISPVLATVGSTPIYALYDASSKGGCEGGAPACPVPPDSKLTLNAAALLQQGYGIPCAIAPSNPNCNKPLPDNLSVDPETHAITPGVVLTKAELDVIQTRVADLNKIIKDGAEDVGYKVWDINPILKALATTGIPIGGLTVSSAYLTGGVFSYDGVHPTSLGQALIADEQVKFINVMWGNSLPEVNLYPYIFNGNTSSGGYPPPPASAFVGPLTNDQVIEAAAAIYSPENWENGLKDLFPLPAFGRKAVGDPHGMPVSPGHEVSGDRSDRIH